MSHRHLFLIDYYLLEKNESNAFEFGIEKLDQNLLKCAEPDRGEHPEAALSEYFPLLRLLQELRDFAEQYEGDARKKKQSLCKTQLQTIAQFASRSAMPTVVPVKDEDREPNPPELPRLLQQFYWSYRRHAMRYSIPSVDGSLMLQQLYVVQHQRAPRQGPPVPIRALTGNAEAGRGGLDER